ncbi:MAG: hypothetical protein PHF46_01475 [Candidatus Gracilibacteria bacterium]|nr:hypothetical protein [Candidatus Gracilibacteria bacterium]
MYKNYLKGQQFISEEKKYFFPYILIILSLILSWFVLKDLYYKNIDLSESLNTATEEMKTKEQTLKNYNDIKAKIDTNAEEKRVMDKYAGDFKEYAIIESIFSKSKFSTNQFVGIGAYVSIKNLNVTKGEKLTNSLNMANITINLEAQNLQELKIFLESLVNDKENSRFLIKDFSAPFDSKNTGSSMQATVNLGMYYLEK